LAARCSKSIGVKSDPLHRAPLSPKLVAVTEPVFAQGYGDGANLAWRIAERGIEPHIPVIDRSARRDATFERANFTFDREGDRHICPGGKLLKHCGG
jgi:hypothetical protein